VEAAIATAVDGDYEAVQGLTPTAQAALVMRRYMHEFDVSHDCFAGFPMVAHANAESNPNAMYRKAISQDTYLRSGMVSDPLNMFDIAPTADGAAALILARADLLPAYFPHPRVRISGSSMASDTRLHDRQPAGLDAPAFVRACRRRLAFSRRHRFVRAL
jgi:acetyl-CoA C-acetyltransferase